MEDRKFLFISLIVSFVLIFGAVLFLSKGSTNITGRKVDVNLLVKADSHVKGPGDAKVTIVEFSDFQCPACKASQPELDQVYAKYKDKVKVVYRDYPLTTIHQYAQRSAEAAEFASASGKFWEFHDLLFTNQETWAASTDQNKLDEYLVSYAKKLGLDDKKMIEALNNKTYAARVAEDVSDGSAIGIDSTPTFFVNGEETGGYSVDELSRLIEKNLK